jgi:hypothetical protein
VNHPTSASLIEYRVIVRRFRSEFGCPMANGRLVDRESDIFLCNTRDGSSTYEHQSRDSISTIMQAFAVVFTGNGLLTKQVRCCHPLYLSFQHATITTSCCNSASSLSTTAASNCPHSLHLSLIKLGRKDAVAVVDIKDDNHLDGCQVYG